MTTPTGFVVEPSSIPGAGLGAWAKKRVRMYTIIGEYEGEEHRNEEPLSHYQWTVRLFKRAGWSWPLLDYIKLLKKKNSI